jgi:hypothetical protein
MQALTSSSARFLAPYSKVGQYSNDFQNDFTRSKENTTMRRTYYVHFCRTRKIIPRLAIVVICLACQVNAFAMKWGMAGRDCVGKGISCEMRVPRKKESFSNVDLYYSKSDGLSLVVARKELEPGDIDRLFSKAYYVQDNDWILSDSLRKSLGAPQGFKVSKGNYKFSKTGNGFRIWFGRPMQ